jgi:hypothetical protein
VYYSKKTLDDVIRQSNLSQNPVVGIRIKSMGVSKVFGPSRRQLSVDLVLANIGNAPAIEILVDAEIELQYSNIEGEKIIPDRIKPRSVPFIRPGEEVAKNPFISPNFGNDCVTHLFDDFRECTRLNILRIDTDPTREPYKTPKLTIIAYYANNVGQYFNSRYETHCDLQKIPEDNKTATLTQVFIPRPKFHSGPTTKEQMNREISERDQKRKLCGW